MESKYTSKENAAFQIFESLKNDRKKRNKHKKFLVEGVRPINTLIKKGWGISDIIYQDKTHLSDWAMEIIKNNPKAEIYKMSPELFARLSDRDEPSEIIVASKTRTYSLPTSKATAEDIFLIIDRVKNPGNLGSIIRSANARGVLGIGIVGHATDVFDSQCIRASVGSCFEMPVEYFDSQNEMMIWLNALKKSREVEVVATSAKAKASVYDFKQTKTTVLLVGSEAEGLSQFLLDLADTNISLPMQGEVTSLNISCATTALLYLIKR